jgi:hypothetical protein
MRGLLILGAIAGLSGGSGIAPVSKAVAQAPNAAWEIGPNIRGRNYSAGMPPSPIRAGRGWWFDFPFPSEAAGHVHYVTFKPGSLAGKSKIVMQYRIDAAPGVRFVARDKAQSPATVSLYVQRRGDYWSGTGPYQFHRWFAPPATVRAIAPGVHEMSVSLRDPGWVGVQGKASAANGAAFNAALADTERVGILFGSAGLRGHGVYSTGPARFTLISFRII